MENCTWQHVRDRYRSLWKTQCGNEFQLAEENGYQFCPYCGNVISEGGGAVSSALYSVGTWDTDKQAYTPQQGVTVPAFNCTLAQLRQAIRELRQMGYSAHRFRDHDGTHEDNDWAVLVERTDGKHWKEIRKGWRR